MRSAKETEQLHSCLKCYTVDFSVTININFLILIRIFSISRLGINSHLTKAANAKDTLAFFTLVGFVIGNLFAYPLQDAAFSASFCWRFVIILAVDTFSLLPLLSERVNDAMLLYFCRVNVNSSNPLRPKHEEPGKRPVHCATEVPCWLQRVAPMFVHIGTRQ